MAHRPSESGAEAFERHYHQLYGERWPQLRQALGAPAAKVSLVGLRGEFSLDPASLAVTQVFDLQGDEKVIDLCAAPGGKALALALRLPAGQLHVNDISASRYHRLRHNFTLLPAGSGVQVSYSCSDATLWGRRHPGYASHILLDAPCSSERHLLHSATHLHRWSPARARMLAVRQIALACSASDGLAAGGFLLYVTCSLNPLENEQMIDRLLRKRPSLTPVAVNMAGLELRRHGGQLLPDRLNGSGPLYLCYLRKHRDEI